MATGVPSTHHDRPAGPLFWIVWHALCLAVLVSAPLRFRLGESLATTPLLWMPQIVAMGASYLGLAAVGALLKPRPVVRDLLVLAASGVAIYGAAFVLLSLRSDVPLSRSLVAISAVLAVALVSLPVLLGRHRPFGVLIPASVMVGLVVAPGRSEPERVGLQVVFGARSLSKVPFVIAYDQRLFEKYGLDVNIWMPPPETAGESVIVSSGIARPVRPDILVDGHSPIMYRMVTEAGFPPMIAIAGGDCVARTHIVGQKGLERLEDLKGKRIGINRQRSTTGYVARLLAQRMGWNPIFELSILEFGRDAESLRKGLVDAVVANERTYAILEKEGYPVLANTMEWNEPMAGNSVLVEPDWLKAEGHRDVALRFLKASAEGLALFHRNPDLARQVMAKWSGLMDEDDGEVIYGRGSSFSQKPYPCVDGVRKTMELYDSNEMRRRTAESFYDDSLMRELDESGFLDSLYK